MDRFGRRLNTRSVFYVCVRSTCIVREFWGLQLGREFLKKEGWKEKSREHCFQPDTSFKSLCRTVFCEIYRQITSVRQIIQMEEVIFFQEERNSSRREVLFFFFLLLLLLLLLLFCFTRNPHFGFPLSNGQSLVFCHRDEDQVKAGRRAKHFKIITFSLCLYFCTITPPWPPPQKKNKLKQIYYRGEKEYGGGTKDTTVNGVQIKLYNFKTHL